MTVLEALPVFNQPTADDVAYVLTTAVAVLETNGWLQGNLYDAAEAETGTPRSACRVCAVGALNVASAGTPVLGLSESERDLPKAVILADMARAALGEHIGPEGVTVWNDAPGRTVEQVIDVMRTAAANLLEGRR
ncbi:hypothetical protein [Streptomyces sp. NPDC006640]|uniref:DUF6197 family protein n=1 Tax=unclassified Streptomyces TaxID=2593676 RepID=UPI00369194D0